MAIPERLEALRAGVAGCRLAAFADLAAGLVLAASSTTRPPQEELDALCALATRSLDEGGEAVPGDRNTATKAAGSPPGDWAIALAPGRACVFVRSPLEPAEAVCCEGAPGMDLAAALARGRAFLLAIGKTP